MQDEKKVDEFELSRAKRKITRIQFHPLKNKRELDPNLIGFASVVYDDSLFIGSLFVRKFNNKYRIGFPDIQLKSGGVIQIINPRNFEVSKAFEDAIIECVENYLTNNQLNFDL